MHLITVIAVHNAEKNNVNITKVLNLKKTVLVALLVQYCEDLYYLHSPNVYMNYK